jgi:glycosyltransferase involved in cell wall biosynthesis
MDMHTPVQLSVIIPVRGNATWINEALRSVVNDAIEGQEIIVVDNGVSSETATNLQHWKESSGMIRITEEHHQGIVHALNNGIRNSQGRFIARMDADDISLPGRFRSQRNYLHDHPNIGVVAGRAEILNESSANEGMCYYVRDNNALITFEEISANRFVESPLIHPTVMFHKRLIGQFGDYREGNFPEDYELWLRWLNQNVQMVKLNQTVLQWRDHLSRLTRTGEPYQQEAFDRIRYRYLAVWVNTHVIPARQIWVWGGGKLARRKVKLLQEQGINVTGFIDIHPHRVVQSYPVTHFTKLKKYNPQIFIISVVSNRGKGNEIRNFLTLHGYREMSDFIIAG